MGTLGGLSEAEARIAELRQELATAEQARDKYLALWRETALMVREERERVARLAALEAAARALLTTRSGPTFMNAYEDLEAAVAALDGPAGPLAEPCPACGGELYDQIVRDPVTHRPRCPHCGADVGVADDEESSSPRAGDELT